MQPREAQARRRGNVEANEIPNLPASARAVSPRVVVAKATHLNGGDGPQPSCGRLFAMVGGFRLPASCARLHPGVPTLAAAAPIVAGCVGAGPGKRILWLGSVACCDS